MNLLQHLLHSFSGVARSARKRMVLGSVLAAVVVVACGAESGGADSEGATDTNTNWLSRCSEDVECDAEQRCLCGICSVACDSSQDCQDIDPASGCLPTSECAEQPAVCGRGDWQAAEPPSTPAASLPEQICSYPIEAYVSFGGCDVTLNCDGPTAFEDACGCGCTDSVSQVRSVTNSTDDSPADDSPADDAASSELPEGCETDGVRYITSPGPDSCAGASIVCDDHESYVENACGCGCEAVPEDCALPGRRYFRQGSEACSALSFGCAEHERPFNDECGCGCASGDQAMALSCPQRREAYEVFGACDLDANCEMFEDECGCGCWESTDCGDVLLSYREALDDARICASDLDCELIVNDLCGLRGASRDVTECSFALNAGRDSDALDQAANAMAECFGYEADCDCDLGQAAVCEGERCLVLR